MPLSTFLTFLAFLTRKLHWSRANHKTLPEIRREALGRRLAAEQTRCLLDGLVRAIWLRFVTTKTGSRATHPWQGKLLLFSGGTNARKVRKARKGGACHDDLSEQRLRFPGTWERFPAGPLERHESLGPLTGIPANEKASR